jgi:hypothetical protein
MPTVNVSTSTVSFPSSVFTEHPTSPVTTVYPNLPNISSESSYARTSRSSLRASALEVHDLIWLAESSGNVEGRLNRLYESNAGLSPIFSSAYSRLDTITTSLQEHVYYRDLVASNQRYTFVNTSPVSRQGPQAHSVDRQSPRVRTHRDPWVGHLEDMERNRNCL